MKKLIQTALSSATLLPLLAFAQDALPSVNIGSRGEAIAFIGRMAGLAFTILVVLAVFFILWAAWLYLSAGDDSKAADGAKKRVLAAAIAIGIALLARGIPLLVGNLLGANYTSPF